MKAHCPIVLYHYEDGRPELVPDPAQKGQHKTGKKVKLIPKVTEIDEANWSA